MKTVQLAQEIEKLASKAPSNATIVDQLQQIQHETEQFMENLLIIHSTEAPSQALEFTQKIHKWMTNLTLDLIKQQKVYSRINPKEVILNTMKCLS
ncbi:unnamed protein product [Bursaphelenchus okinawaensis]|uniref:Uncharacterized protein n=1 Tax=Bursaphelenchus okinawaensis TaxID=465554 RepID=A0A811JR50_9BILA|nr:unnamed protein product [Bursaphelenchus okinawaensis]CAG9078905.1 unnamed protein product [Bursaphelenchus okinawaensis]